MAAAGAVVALAPVAARTSEGLKSGPWGLAIILLLCVAVYFLWRSMNRHLKKARTHFQADPSQRSGQQPSMPQRSERPQPGSTAAVDRDPSASGGDSTNRL